MLSKWWLFAVPLMAVLCADSDALEAGAAKVEITPPLGSPMAGYGDRMGRGSLSIHDPLWARCLYLTDGATSVFIISADLCFITQDLRARVLELAPQDIPRESIILTATHTHNGSGGMAKSLFMRPLTGRFVPELLDQTARAFVEAMRLAREGRKRAALGFGVCEPNDLVANRREPGGPTDPQIGVLRVDDADGTPIAVAACMAGHPTLLDTEHRYAISADYPGAFCRAMEEAYGSTCVPMFFNGADGNQKPITPDGTSGWTEVDAVGTALAGKAKSVIDTLKCADLKLHLGYATPELPRTTAPKAVPAEGTLHTLEAGDLVLAFVPGEPCVEIGLELRKQALARGYTHAMIVGLSDEYLGYFVPMPYYSQIIYETTMDYYGPRMPEWLYAEYGKLMTRGTSPAAPSAPEPAKSGTLDCGNGTGIKHIVLTGTPYEIGYQHGAAYGDAISGKFAKEIEAPLTKGELAPAQGYWKTASRYLNVTPITLRMLCMGTRPMLQGLSTDIFDEVAGLADGAQIPFDSAWLLQCMPTMAARPTKDAFFRAPYCTIFATVGDRAGAADVMVARNLDWDTARISDADDEPVVVEVHPKTGHRYAQVGFAWNVGVFTGMNDAGLVLCAERVDGLGTPPADKAPVEMVLRDLLQICSEIDVAVNMLSGHSELAGYHVLAAGPGGMRAAVVEFGGQAPVVRKADTGLLLGTLPDSDKADQNARTRYSRVKELVQGEHIVAATKMRSILADSRSDLSDAGGIWNQNTKYSVVFEPRARTMSVACRTADGKPSGYAKLEFEPPPEPKPAAKPSGKTESTTKKQGKGAR